MSFLDLALNRYSCRKFTDEPVTDEQLEQILTAARSAPTATNAQAYKIWVFKSPEAIAKMNLATKNGFGAKTMLLLGADPNAAWTRQDDGHSFADVDAGIIGAHILLAVQDLGLGTTWVGRVNPEILGEQFPETKSYTIVGVFPIGHPAPEGAGQPSKMHGDRKPLADVVSTL